MQEEPKGPSMNLIDCIKELSDRQTKIINNFKAWRPVKKVAYDFFYPHNLKWSASCGKWGEIVGENDTMVRQEILFGCRTDGVYNRTNNLWDGTSSLVVLGEVDIPKRGYSIPKRLDGMTNNYHDLKRRINVK